MTIFVKVFIYFILTKSFIIEYNKSYPCFRNHTIFKGTLFWDVLINGLDKGCFAHLNIVKCRSSLLHKLVILYAEMPTADRPMAQWPTDPKTKIFTHNWMDSSTNFQAPPHAAIFFDLVIRFITNRKYAFFFISRSDCQLSLIYWIKIDHVQL